MTPFAKKVIRGTFQSRTFLAAGIALVRACFGLKMHGTQFVPRDRAVIFAGNHGSHYDGIFSMVSAYLVQGGRVPTAVAWGGTRDFPITKQLVESRALELIFTELNPSTQSQAEVLAAVIDRLESGTSVVIHAEADPQIALSRFMPGAAAAARAAEVPLVPFTLRGVQPLWKVLPWPDRWHGDVSIHFHPAMEPREYAHLRAREAAESMTAELRRRVASAIDYPDGMAAGVSASL